MNSENTRKRFGDVASFSRGLTFAKGDVATDTSKCVLRSNNIDLASHSLDLGEIACLKEDFVIPDDKKLHKGDIFICMSNGSTQHLGKVAYIDEDMDYAFGGFMGAIHPNRSIVSPKYAFYACLSAEYRHFLSSVFNGININNLKWSDLSRFTFPVPPLPEQEHIVAELDLLSGIIDKYKQQLKELDTLAQSIFYDMFGDGAIGVDKWEVKTLGDIGTFQRGGGFLKTDFVNNGFPCLHYGQIHTRLGIATYSHLTCIPQTLLSKTKLASPGDLILAITSEDVEGSCKSTAWMGDYEIAVGAHAAIFKHSLNPIFASYFTKSSHFNAAKQRYTHGIKVVEISPKDIAKITIAIPPLPLQQSFAEKIKAIEAQKESVKQAIKETETLFNSRMDYYFN